jgi:hypothetical protein
MKSFAIGRTDRLGDPVSRDVSALDDLELATGQRLGFTAYDRDGGAC